MLSGPGISLESQFKQFRSTSSMDDCILVILAVLANKSFRQYISMLYPEPLLGPQILVLGS